MLVACGASPAPAIPLRAIKSAQQAIDQMKAAGFVINDTLPRTDGDRALDPLYKDHKSFEVIEAGNKRAGALSLCHQKSDCDQLYESLQLSAKMGLVRVWRSQDGLLVCMMDSALSQPAADQLQSIVENLKVAVTTPAAPPNQALQRTPLAATRSHRF